MTTFSKITNPRQLRMASQPMDRTATVETSGGPAPSAMPKLDWRDQQWHDQNNPQPNGGTPAMRGIRGNGPVGGITRMGASAPGGMALDDGYRIGGSSAPASPAASTAAPAASDPQTNFRNRMATGVPLSPEEKSQANQFAGRWGRIFDPEKGYSAPVPAFAAGGSPPVGKPVIVGENGPELAVFRQPAEIVPNHMLTESSVGRSVQGPYGSGAMLDTGKVDNDPKATSLRDQMRIIDSTATGNAVTTPTGSRISADAASVSTVPLQRMAGLPDPMTGKPTGAIGEGSTYSVKPKKTDRSKPSARALRDYMNSPQAVRDQIMTANEDTRFNRMQTLSEERYQRMRADSKSDQETERARVKAEKDLETKAMTEGLGLMLQRFGDSGHLSPGDMEIWNKAKDDPKKAASVGKLLMEFGNERMTAEQKVKDKVAELKAETDFANDNPPKASVQPMENTGYGIAMAGGRPMGTVPLKGANTAVTPQQLADFGMVPDSANVGGVRFTKPKPKMDTIKIMDREGKIQSWDPAYEVPTGWTVVKKKAADGGSAPAAGATTAPAAAAAAPAKAATADLVSIIGRLNK